MSRGFQEWQKVESIGIIFQWKSLALVTGSVVIAKVDASKFCHLGDFWPFFSVYLIFGKTLYAFRQIFIAANGQIATLVTFGPFSGFI